MGNISRSRVSERERSMYSLKHLLHSRDGNFNSIQIFSAKELTQATNHYRKPFVDTDYGRMQDGFLKGRRVYVKYATESDLYQRAINEVVFASQVNNHKNILMLLGCCLETEFPVLVYEYAENGTLSRHIRTTGSRNHQQLLPWNGRLKVAKEIADALAYLHTGLSTPIVHRCVKASNILLDGNYVAKLSEFSLSISMPSGGECLETSVVGTTGHGAPEYMATGKLTEKCDVYLFGALLIEILSGEGYVELQNMNRRKYKKDFFCETNLKYVHQAIIEAAKKYIGPEHMTESHLKQSMACTKLGLKCLKGSAQERPANDDRSCKRAQEDNRDFSAVFPEPQQSQRQAPSILMFLIRNSPTLD